MNPCIPPPPKIATWYAKGLPRPDALTAASTKHPRGTKLRVYHGPRSVVVVVNDYGPERWTGVDIDLSRGAFMVLAPLQKGRINVRIEVLHEARRVEDRGQGRPSGGDGVGRPLHQAQVAEGVAGSAVPHSWWEACLHRVQACGRSCSKAPALYTFQAAIAWLHGRGV